MIGGHGGNIYALARQLDCDPAHISDMSANVNPLGPMPELMAHLKEQLPLITALPEVDAATICRAFAQYHGIDPARVMAGNGSTELIYRIPRALDSRRALIVGPTYADYRDACVMHGTACEHFICRPEDDFLPDMDLLCQAALNANLVFLCNPNNPTGSLLHRDAIEDICRRLPGTIFVIDESYLPFAPQPETASMINVDLPNLIVLNSMSKAFRIPGLRIGFLKATDGLMQKLSPLALPWSVNSLAQAAVTWLMDNAALVEAFLATTRTMLFKEKARIEEQIHSQGDIRCFPSATSFILMQLPTQKPSHMVWQHMADYHILIRDCSNFEGLDESYIRLSLKSSAENQQAADHLIELCRSSHAD